MKVYLVVEQKNYYNTFQPKELKKKYIILCLLLGII